MNAKKEKITATRRQQFAETVLGVLIVIVSKDTRGRTTGLANVCKNLEIVCIEQQRQQQQKQQEK